MSLQKIKETIKQNIEGLNQEKMYDLMLENYKTLRLVDCNQSWMIPSFEKISDFLLPKNFNETSILEFIDEIAELQEKNPYLMYFLNDAGKNNYETLSNKIQKEGKIVFPQVIAYAVVLERLTKSLSEDPFLLEEVYCHFKKIRKLEDTFKNLPLFHKIKLLSIEKPLKASVDYAKSYKLNKIVVFGYLILAGNILEAAVSDLLQRHNSNARVGWILAANIPFPKKYTGKGSVAKKDPKTSVKQKWKDLYQTWNMSFVSKFRDFPFVIPKLLIPQVSNYQNPRKNYMHSRTVALYLYLHFAGFESGKSTLNWYDEKLSEDWGKCNLEMAVEYETEYSKVTKILKQRVDVAAVSESSSGNG